MRMTIALTHGLLHGFKATPCIECFAQGRSWSVYYYCFPIASIQETLALIISSLTFETFFMSLENSINEKWDGRKLKTIFAYTECQGFWNRNADSLEYKIIKLCLNGTWLCREDIQLSLWFPRWTFLEVWLFTPNRLILSVIWEGLLTKKAFFVPETGLIPWERAVNEWTVPSLIDLTF